MKQLFKRSLIVVFFIMFTLVFYCNTSYALLEIGPEDFNSEILGKYLDDFMIKSNFSINLNKYQIVSMVREGNLIKYSIISRGFSYGPIYVDVDKSSNKIVHMKYFIYANTATNEELNSLYDAWLPVVTGRYGEPTEEKSAMLFMGEQVPAKYARFYEAGHYKYFFGGYRTPGPALESKKGILFEVTAL